MVHHCSFTTYQSSPNAKKNFFVGRIIGDVGAALVFYLVQFSIFDTRDLKLLFFSFRNHKSLKSLHLNKKCFVTFKKGPFFASMFALLFYFGVSQVGHFIS
jgi:hypothetical protein